MNDPTPTLTDEQREDVEDALHNALCDCRDRGTGFTFRSADGRKATDALAPIIARMVADAEERGRAEVIAAVEAVLDERLRAYRDLPYLSTLVEFTNATRAALTERRPS